jgi:hypothetical protein
MLRATLASATLALKIAAPGELPVIEPEVSDIAKAAVIRRLDKTVVPTFRKIVVKQSERMPGFVVCGEFRNWKTDNPDEFERFFAVVPGSFALLDRDGDGLVDKYWKLNGCR